MERICNCNKEECRVCRLFNQMGVEMAGLKKQRAQEDVKKKKEKSKGLGDTIAKGLASIGITPELVEKVTGKGCGCKRRKKLLNKLIPYKSDEIKQPEENSESKDS